MEGHIANARALPDGWHKGPDGEWRYRTVTDSAWEVICSGCGDDLGPREEQSEAVQRLRGPYPSKEAAWDAVKRHTTGRD